MGGGSGGGAGGGAGAPPADLAAMLSGMMGGGGAAGAMGGGAGAAAPPDLSAMMAALGGLGGGLGGLAGLGLPAPVADPESAFATQLQQLQVGRDGGWCCVDASPIEQQAELSASPPFTNSPPPPRAAPQDMGFFDRDANIRALQATGGNVNAAVDRLLSGM
jgi:ubiquilin